MAFHKIFQIWITQEFFWAIKLKAITSQLIGIGHIGIVWHTAGHPVMTSDSFQPPDFIDIADSHSIRLIGSVFL